MDFVIICTYRRKYGIPSVLAACSLLYPTSILRNCQLILIGSHVKSCVLSENHGKAEKKERNSRDGADKIRAKKRRQRTLAETDSRAFGQKKEQKSEEYVSLHESSSEELSAGETQQRPTARCLRGPRRRSDSHRFLQARYPGLQEVNGSLTAINGAPNGRVPAWRSWRKPMEQRIYGQRFACLLFFLYFCKTIQYPI